MNISHVSPVSGLDQSLALFTPSRKKLFAGGLIFLPLGIKLDPRPDRSTPGRPIPEKLPDSRWNRRAASAVFSGQSL